MNELKRTCELREFRLDQEFPFAHLPPMPTVCLLVADEFDASTNLAGLVKALTSIGCTFLMTWGEAADRLEDELDWILVDMSLADGGDGPTAAVTTCHKGESADEVAFFLVRAAIPDAAAIRCCVGFFDGAAGEVELREQILKTMGN